MFEKVSYGGLILAMFEKVCHGDNLFSVSYTVMTIKFVEFFIYFKTLHVIVKINMVTLEVVPLEFNTLGSASLPLLEAILEFLNRQCLQGVDSRLFNFLHRPPVLVLHIFFDSEECPKVIWSQIWRLGTMSHH